jgi:hypothetical protein
MDRASEFVGTMSRIFCAFWLRFSALLSLREFDAIQPLFTSRNVDDGLKSREMAAKWTDNRVRTDALIETAEGTVHC